MKPRIRMIELTPSNSEVQCYVCYQPLGTHQSTAFPLCEHGVHFDCVNTTILFEPQCPPCQFKTIDNHYMAELYLKVLDAEITRYNQRLQFYGTAVEMLLEVFEGHPSDFECVYEWYQQLYLGESTPQELHSRVQNGFLRMPFCIAQCFNIK